MLDECVGLKPAPAPAPDPAPAQAPVDPAQGADARFSRVAPGAFDFYVLSLSWSSSFCATGGDDRAPDQCATGAGLGFVLHGLWPQYERGFPSDCDTNAGQPSRLALAATHGTYPTEGLARYEWRKHGTCTGLSPAEYFASAARAYRSIAIPAALRAPTSDASASPAQIVRAFDDANPNLRADTIAVTCASGLLQEVRVCLTKDLRAFRSCPEVVRGSCRAGSIGVPAVR